MINGTGKVNLNFHDFTHGSKGFMIWFLPIAVVFFLYAFSLAIMLLLSTNPALSENYLMMWLGFFIMLSVLIWFTSSTFYALKTTQYIEFRKKIIFIRLYFCRKVHFDLNEIEQVSEFKINRLMSQTRTFPAGGKGVEIYLKNGKKYLISPNIEGFEEIKSYFKEMSSIILIK